MTGERRGEVKWLKTCNFNEESTNCASVRPKYSRVSESLRFVTPSALQCSLFCGGKQCKYDNPMKWDDKEMAIKGLYSSWTTESILATSRPSSLLIEEFNIIGQFKRAGITSIINLQHPGEHFSCGPGLLESGFTYEPQQFMDNDIFFYNFNWDDYGVRSLPAIADMVKVMDFTVSEGKVAVHCHAGLGRTGVLIACYLIYSKRVNANQAIQIVRHNRPRSVQTRGQIRCVRDFEKFISPCRLIFQIDRPYATFSLDLFLKRQRHILHGEESKILRYVPKIILRICDRLLILHGNQTNFHDVILEQCRSRSFREFNISSQHHQNKTNTHIAESDNTRDSSQSLFCNKDMLDRSLPEGIDKWQSLTGDTPNEPPLLLDEHNPRLARSSSDSLLSQPDLRKAAVKRDRISFQQVHISSYDIDIKSSSSLLSRNNRLEPLNVNITQKLCESGFSLDKSMSRPASLDDLTNGNQDDNDDQRIRTDSFNNNDNLNSSDDTYNLIGNITKAIAMRCGDIRVVSKIDKYKRLLNKSDSAWEKIEIEDNPFVLVGLLFSWLEHLQEPILRQADLIAFQEQETDNQWFQRSLTKEKRLTISCLMTLVAKIGPLSGDMEDRILRRMATTLTADQSLPRHNSSHKSLENDKADTTGLGIFLLPLLTIWYKQLID